ncbi:L-lysine 6-monooxygenase [Actinoplanes sp. ATCC 53533]|uniref:lysine N(6)-hydroxylase/L-ornithine N(5)-oxygenase family protein n=1 Tax=Actinoplanes sp. ATCC 53533 TaxID=1288362 RepID=UPI000F769839|nr:lysine N(6)-hydroxylase/L-ornithine N(5)-oxygenase family protein [Actinoplanes sp. ATCC 53533]RSM74536.1 L-lysine 6-monooxygenase [Actinoplanes sp. ATCC 53533]
MSEPELDVVGIGFGPSNLAMAIAVAEHNDTQGPDRGVRARFLERQEAFGWHRGMLLDDATMQVSFLKDLVTLRNPTSEFSFLRYLHSQGRLIDFINHKNLFPLRVEFHDYFAWAAAQVDDQVTYDTEVLSVTPVLAGGDVVAVDVLSRHGEELSTHRARNLVIGTGLRPRLPEGVTASDRVWHTSDLLHNMPKLRGTEPRRIVVVGAGQSAAEAVATMHREFPTAEICAVFSRYGYSPADDSSFANRIFDPAAVDDFYDAPEHVKQQLMGYHANTNYSVVDMDLIDDLYRRAYQEKVLGKQRLRMLNVSRMTEVADGPDQVVASVRSLVTGETTRLAADVVICATGYHQADPYAVLGELGDLCHRDEEGRPKVDRDYRAATDPRLRVGIYLQGGTEHTHGITSALLSNTAIRVGEILDSVVTRRTAPALVGV